MGLIPSRLGNSGQVLLEICLRRTDGWNSLHLCRVYPVSTSLNFLNGVAMFRKLTFPLVAVLAVVAGGCANIMAASPAKTADGALVGTNDMTLYVFDKDAAASGKSVCNGPCAKNWPPLAAAEGATPSADWTVVVRDDGSKQWAYKGKPVYFWGKDQKPGDRTGDGVNGLWHVAKP
jgi:predicted lipoprotein with Yx(FWY)xxD motif